MKEMTTPVQAVTAQDLNTGDLYIVMMQKGNTLQKQAIAIEDIIRHQDTVKIILQGIKNPIVKKSSQKVFIQDMRVLQ